MDINLALAIATGLLQVVDKLMTILAVKKQTAEMTPEQEAEYDALVKSRVTQPWWQPSQ